MEKISGFLLQTALISIASISFCFSLPEDSTYNKQNDVISTGSDYTLYNKQITSVPAKNILELPDLFPSIILSGNGYINRASPVKNNAFKINGIDFSNPYYGGFGNITSSKLPTPSVYAVDRVDFNASDLFVNHGNDLGGAIDFTLKRGSTEKFEVYARLSTPISSLYGSVNNVQVIQQQNGTLQKVDSGNSLKLQSSGDINLEFGFGGPLKLIDNSSFFISFRNMTQSNDAGLKVIDPLNNNLGLLPNQGTWLQNLTGSVDIELSKDMHLQVDGMYGISSWESSSWGWLYANTPGYINNVSNGIPERVSKQNVQNYIISNISARIIQKLSSTLSYSLGISKINNVYESAKRADFSNPDFFTGFKTIKPRDNYSLKNIKDSIIIIPGGDRVMDDYQAASVIGRSKDGWLLGDIPVINPMTGYIDGNADYSLADNPYGLQFYGHGNSSGFEFNSSDEWKFKGEINIISSIFNNKNNIKAGFDASIYSLRKYSVSNPWDANPSNDIYTDEYGGDIFVDSTLKSLTNKPKEPILGALYIQDEFYIGNLSLLAGLRYDYINTNTSYIDRENSMNKTTLSDSKSFFYISPRINLGYKIDGDNNVSLGYGIFRRVMPFIYYYQNNLSQYISANSNNGNPDLGMMKSENLQLSYSTYLFKYLNFSLTAYYNSITNEANPSYVQNVPNPYYTFNNSKDPTKSQGIELLLSKNITDNLGIYINYVYTNSKSVNISSVGLFSIPLSPVLTDENIAHRANLSLTGLINKNEGGNFLGFYPFENMAFNITGTYRTGFPTTPYNLAGIPIGEINSINQPDYWTANLRISKRILLNSISQTIIIIPYIEFSIDIYNIFNRTKELYYSNDKVSLIRVKSDFDPTVFYAKGDNKTIESISTDQYDNYGNRKYCKAIDYNNDGMNTQDEKFTGYQKYLENRMQLQVNHQMPRTVYFNLAIGF